MALRGTRSQNTQPPKASFKGMPSSRTSTRLAPLAPTPLAVAPRVVGFAVRLLLRRKRVNPGIWRNPSSSVRTAWLFNSAGVSATMLAAVSAIWVGVRSPVTTNVSLTGEGLRVMVSDETDWSQSSETEEKPGAETFTLPDGAGGTI